MTIKENKMNDCKELNVTNNKIEKQKEPLAFSEITLIGCFLYFAIFSMLAVGSLYEYFSGNYTLYWEGFPFIAILYCTFCVPMFLYIFYHYRFFLLPFTKIGSEVIGKVTSIKNVNGKFLLPLFEREVTYKSLNGEIKTLKYKSFFKEFEFDIGDEIHYDSNVKAISIVPFSGKDVLCFDNVYSFIMAYNKIPITLMKVKFG